MSTYWPTLRLSIDLISRKGGSSDFYATFLFLLRRYTCSLPFSRTFPSERVRARFMSKFLLHLPLISFGDNDGQVAFNLIRLQEILFSYLHFLLSSWNLYFAVKFNFSFLQDTSLLLSKSSDSFDTFSFPIFFSSYSLAD